MQVQSTDEDYECRQEVSPSPQRTSTVSRRRSSVVTFDAALLLGAGPPGYGQGYASSGSDNAFPAGLHSYLTRGRSGLHGSSVADGPSSANGSLGGSNLSSAVSLGVEPAGPPGRALHHTRSRNASLGRALVDGRSSNPHSGMRRAAAEDAAPAQQHFCVQGAGSASIDRRGLAVTAAGATRRASELSISNWRTSNPQTGVAVAGAASLHVSGGMAIDYQDHSGYSQDLDEERPQDLDVELPREAPPLVPMRSSNCGGVDQTGRPASRLRSGRFMKMLTGIFTTSDGRPLAQTHNGYTTPMPPSQPLSPSGPTRRRSLFNAPVSGSGASASSASSAGAVAPARTVAWESLNVPRANDNLLTGGNPNRPHQPLRGTSFHATALPAATSAPVATAPLVPSGVPHRSLSDAQVLMGASSTTAPATLQASPLGTQDGRATAGLASRGSSRRPLVCTLPQI